MKKRTKKLLLIGGVGDAGASAPQQIRVFLLLFLQKKKRLLPLLVLSSCISPDAHAPPFAQRDYAPFSRAAAVAVAMDEWRLWGGHVDDDQGKDYVQTDATMPERQPGLWQRVGEYWWEGMNAGAPEDGWTGKHDARGKVFPVPANGRYAWSAAFISYVMRIAGAGEAFPYAPNHAYYINYAARAAEGNVRDPLLIAEDPKTYAPRQGDLLCFGRGRDRDMRFADLPTDYAFPAHCAIVVAAVPSQLSVIGGNVDDAVTLTHVRTDVAGLVAPGGEKWFVVLRVMYAAP